MNFLKKVFDHEYKELTKFQKIADEIEKLDAEMSEKSDEELKAKTKEFQERLQNGETLEDVKVEAFAVAREAAFRVIGEKPYYVQILGGLAIHYGNIAEMKTGEGKTLTSTMPAYLNALTGKGVHIITVNEYLAGRDAEWMGNIYRFLGLTVGVNYRELSSQEKREAYQCDIMYSTNNEIGFDYLRDNMVVNAESRVQRKLNFAIVDEVDSVLIDEAYIYDEKTKAVTLDEKGIAKAEKAFGVDNIYDMEHTNLVHHINQALRANYAMKVDVDYVVADGKIVIVDQFTGRLMQGRNYSDGLHQAIEAKEGVEIQEETKTLATITFQNLFRMYDKLAGMTGTAKTEEEEFRDIYNMYVICIPTNKPVIRKDYGDLIFATAKGKYKAIVNEIVERHKTGQPVLVGTVAVETSELISSMLKKKNIPHEVLNAKNNAREAEIIAKAGEKGAVTIATNMAGRGTDIKLTDEVKELGGLCVIGTERHESRRIDNQLRGRAGRQGDPGFSQFCVSFEDDLMVRFGTDRAKALLQRVGFSDDMSIRNKALSSSIESAQRRVEGNNFDIRKTLLQYDDVINKQREIIYNKRNEILDSESISDTIKETIHNHIEDLVHEHIMPEGHLTEKDLSEIVEAVNENLLRKDMKVDEIENMDIPEVVDYIFNRVDQEYVDKMSEVPDDIRNEFEKAVALRVIDTHWMEHINTMSHLREGIHLRGYAQEDPLRAYTTEGYELFDRLLYTIDKETTIYLLRAEVRQNTERKEVAKGEAVRDPQKEKKRQPKKVKKVGRNDPCPCGSGKKYKQCCGK